MARDSLTAFLTEDKQVISLYRKGRGLYLEDHFIWEITRYENEEDELGPECMVTWK